MGTEARARIAFAALLGATLLSFKLVFDNGDYAGPAILGCILAMAISALARRWGAGPILTLEISLAALFWYLTILFEAARSFFGIPTPAAATGLARLVSSAADASAVDFAPVPVRAGYVIMIVAGFWLATTLGEVATFRWRRPLFASLPAIALFTTAMIVGTGEAPAAYLTPFLIALFTFWASEASLRLRSWGRWLGAWEEKKDEPKLVTGALARRMGASCLAVTLAAPIFLPTLGDGWLPWRNDTGDGSGGSGDGSGEVNLLVDLAPQLLEQTDTHLFTVDATEAAYWRLASLTRFDGRFWHPPETEREPINTASIESPPGTDETTPKLVQSVEIESLEGDYLPAAVQPIRLDTDIPVEVDGESWDLQTVVPLNEDDDDETDYTVYSVSSSPTYQELLGAKIAEEPDDEYLDVGGPALDPPVLALLNEWTDEEATPFVNLLSIQERLRNDYFYDEYVEQDLGSKDYLHEFLIENRRGFCQQFATAFALLARQLGYPARVSVGFLPGEKNDSGDFIVRGTNAHAWPEVKFEEYGWVAFEPTARSTANPPSYTLGADHTVDLDDFRTGGNSPNNNPVPGDGDTRPRGDRLPEFETRPAPAPRRVQPIPEPPWQNTFVRLLMVLALLGATWAITVPTLKRERTKRRYRRARTHAEVAIAAFLQFEDDAGEMFLARRPAESARAYTERLQDEARLPAEAAERLAKIYEAAAYSPSGITENQAREAKRAARHLATALWARANLWQKASRLFSVRSLLADVNLRLPKPRPRPA